MAAATQEFTGLRAFLWPVHRRELPKLVPMLLILFFLTFDYNLLRTLKDTLVIATGKGAGAEVIPFVKVYMMFPGSILLTWIFTRLSNRFRREAVFYLMMSIFLGYFLLFLAVLYPYNAQFEANTLGDYLASHLPIGASGFVAMVRNWSFSTFYVMSELWSNIVLFLLFWGFANQVTQLGEAKRFYAILGVATNLSGVIAGEVAVRISSLETITMVPYGKNVWDQKLFLFIMLVLISGGIAIYLYRWMHLKGLDQTEKLSQEREERAVVGKMSMFQNILFLLRSPYLLSIAAVVVAYNMIINLVEVPWKHQVYALYSNPDAYNLYMNRVMEVIGVIATVASLFFTGNIIRLFGWSFTALLTPVLILLTSVTFFGTFFAKEGFSDLASALFGASPLTLVVFFGTLQNCVSRGAKYTVYDATKELAFVPLDQETKIKGKAAIDGICNRLGKSGGAAIHQGLLLSFGSLIASLPYIAGAIFVIIIFWAFAVTYLGRKFNELSGERPLAVAH